ncbi:hypothetical protein J6590_086232 [Homalodisca vitripennis]|nr:hypothetical protein J6590_086232 [Homalodisca vitripennis]
MQPQLSCACIQAYQTINFCYAVFHGVLDQQSGTQAGACHNGFLHCCLPWSLGPAERYTGRSVSQRISALLSSIESWTSRAIHRQERVTTNFCTAVFHGVLDQQSGTQAKACHNEFLHCCLPWSLGPAERYTGRSVSQRISALLSSTESWTSRAVHRQERVTTNFCTAVFHGVLDQQSGTQAGACHNEFLHCCLPWSLGPAERYTGRSVSQRISALLSSMESWISRAVHRQKRVTTNFCTAVFHGVLDQQSGTQAGACHNEFLHCCLPWSLGPAERYTGRSVSQRISALLSSMESWTSRAVHRQERVTTNFCTAVFHGVLDQQSGTQAGACHNEFLHCCLPWSLGPAERTKIPNSQRREFTLDFSVRPSHLMLWREHLK